MKFLFYFFPVLFILSCTTNKTGGSNSAAMLQSSKWQLTELNGEEMQTNKPMGEIPYLEFLTAGRISGFLSCNRFTGSYSTDKNGEITFDEVATTRMACPDRDEIENTMLAAINHASHYSIKNGSLVLKATDGTTLAVFNKAESSDIVNKYWKLVKLEGQDVKMAKNQEREQYFTLRSDSSVTGFAGCNQFTGQYELERGMRIHFKHVATTLKLCPDVDVNEQEFLKVFNLADNYTIKGERLMLNVGKRAPLAEFEAVYFD